MTQSAYRFQLIAPSDSGFSAPEITTTNTARCDRYLESLRQLRSRAYRQNGIVRSAPGDTSACDRLSDDRRCWHFLAVNEQEQAVGGARCLLHPAETSYEQLQIAQSPWAHHPDWSSKLRCLVEEMLQKVRNEQIRYAELSGWIIAEEYRNTKAVLEILLAPYLWAEIIGPCLFSCIAPVRHSAQSLLRRMGADNLQYRGETLPASFDARYGCSIETLCFDSRRLPPHLTLLLREISSRLAQTPILRQRAGTGEARLRPGFVMTTEKFVGRSRTSLLL